MYYENSAGLIVEQKAEFAKAKRMDINNAEARALQGILEESRKEYIDFARKARSELVTSDAIPIKIRMIDGSFYCPSLSPNTTLYQLYDCIELELMLQDKQVEFHLYTNFPRVHHPPSNQTLRDINAKNNVLYVRES